MMQRFLTPHIPLHRNLTYHAPVVLILTFICCSTTAFALALALRFALARALTLALALALGIVLAIALALAVPLIT